MPPEIRPDDLAYTGGFSGVARPKALQALRADPQIVPRSTYRAETERVRRAAAPPARSVSAHPIHTAGRYFACHDPEGQWIADLKEETK